MESIYFLSILEEGIVLSMGDRVWFYGWYDIGKMSEIEDFFSWKK